MSTLPEGIVSALIQIVLALIASGVAVKLLTLRQDRRKIAGEASTQEANAASTLSGAALQMVEAAQRSAREAEGRATAANKTTDELRQDNEKLWKALNRARWEIHWLKAQEEVLVAALKRANIIVPEAPRPENGFPDFPPPDPKPKPGDDLPPSPEPYGGYNI